MLHQHNILAKCISIISPLLENGKFSVAKVKQTEVEHCKPVSTPHQWHSLFLSTKWNALLLVLIFMKSHIDGCNAQLKSGSVQERLTKFCMIITHQPSTSRGSKGQWITTLNLFGMRCRYIKKTYERFCTKLRSIFRCAPYGVMALHFMSMSFLMDFISTVSSETICVLPLINMLFLHLFSVTEVLQP